MEDLFLWGTEIKVWIELKIIWLELGFSQFSTSSNRFLLVRTFVEQGVQMSVISKRQWCGANPPGALCRLWLEVLAAAYVWVPWKTALLLMRTKGQSHNCVHVVWPMVSFPVLCSLFWTVGRGGGLDLHLSETIDSRILTGQSLFPSSLCLSFQSWALSKPPGPSVFNAFSGLPMA